MIFGKLAISGLVTGAILVPAISLATSVVFRASGASAQSESFRAAAITLSGDNKVYVGAKAAYIVDPGNPNQEGDLWVVWNGPDANPTKIWYYCTVDSTVGVRAYFNSATLSLKTPLPNGSVPPGTYTTLPSAVSAAINNTTFNVGMSDITAADAKVTTQRLFDLGYSATNPVKGVDKGGTIKSVVPVQFSLAARAYRMRGIGASPIVFFVNKLDTTLGGLGYNDPLFPDRTVKNISRITAAAFLDGTFTRTSQMFLQNHGVSKAVATFIREGLSGTYVTTEYTVPQSLGGGMTSQEAGIDAITENPCNETNWVQSNPGVPPTVGGRVRAIGTSSLVYYANLCPNAFGYSFWSHGNLGSGKADNCKYLMIDGVDPLRDEYVDGDMKFIAGNVTFKNVRNGGYCAWNILRAIIPAAGADPYEADIDNIIGTASASSGGENYVAKNDLLVFRSHRATADDPVAANGNSVDLGGPLERGADAGGAVFTIAADRQYFLLFGIELTGLRQ